MNYQREVKRNEVKLLDIPLYDSDGTSRRYYVKIDAKISRPSMRLENR